MSFKFQVPSSKFYVSVYRSKFLVSLVLLLQVIFTISCSIPNLEKPECVGSRETVKQFYSFHFGNELKPNLENLKKSENLLTQRLFEELNNQNETANDYFTQTDDYPKAFRVGGCEVVSQNKTVFEILLFWKDDTRNEQREIKVETVKENEKWLIDKVGNKQ